MQTDHQPRPEAGRRGEGGRTARRAIAILPWAVVAVLVFTNIAALLSERARSAALDILAPAVKAVSADAAGLFPGQGDRGRPEDVLQAATGMAGQDAMLVRELESTVARLRLENSDVKARKADAEERLVKLQAEHAGLQKRHVVLETERDALKDMSVRRAKAVKTVANRISGKLAVHAGELIAELPVRAAPYVGVFALVTGTAYDIRSDCELARTLNGLVLEHQEAPLDTHAVCQYTDRIPGATQVWATVKKRSGSVTASVYQTVENLYPR